MVKRRHRAMVSALFLGLLLGLPARAAEAAVARGHRAPEIDGRAIDSHASVLLASLRGRCVLLEFFGTECPHCHRLAARMNAIHARYAERGLSVLAVSPDASDAITRYGREYHVRHALARVPMDTLLTYDVTAYPLGVLIAPDGRILWTGKLERLTDQVLDAYLARVRILPEAPRAFAHLEAALRTGAYGAVERELDRLRTCRRLDRGDCNFVLSTLAWIDWQRKGAWEHAADDEQRARYAMAYQTYRELEATYADTETAVRAQAAAARLLEDAGRAREIHAQAALERARRAGRWQTAAQQLALLRPVAREHAGTRAASEALQLIRRLTPKG